MENWTTMQSLFVAAVQSLGIVAICTIAFGWIQRHVRHRRLRGAAVGILLGVGSLLAMLTPFVEADGFQVDARSIFIAIATAFGGALSTVIALSIAALTRIAIGGQGVIYGLITIVLISIMAGAWAYLTRDQKRRRLTSWMLLGAILCAPLLMMMLALDKFEPSIATARVLTDMIGAIIFGKLFEGERRRGHRERQLAAAAHTDPLTGLPNRRAFIEALTQLNAQSSGSVTLLMIDADHFKTINDKYGHTAGDEVLQQISARLIKSLRKGDLVARFGGEEFAVLLPIPHPEDGSDFARRLRRKLAGGYEVQGKSITVTVSVGGITLPANKFDFGPAYELADTALYDAKSEGRDRVVFATSKIA